MGASRGSKLNLGSIQYPAAYHEAVIIPAKDITVVSDPAITKALA
jgi:hypothetical protein